MIGFLVIVLAAETEAPRPDLADETGMRRAAAAAAAVARPRAPDRRLCRQAEQGSLARLVGQQAPAVAQFVDTRRVTTLVDDAPGEESVVGVENVAPEADRERFLEVDEVDLQLGTA